jgi:hypothetical protein
MFVHIFCIACHQRLGSFPAKDNTLSARLFSCGNCTRRRRFQHLLRRRCGTITLAAAMAVMYSSYSFEQYRYIVMDGWPQLDEYIYIYAARCHPATSVFRQGILNRVYQRGRRKSTYWVRLYVKLSHTVALIHLQRGIIQGLPSHWVS